MEAQKTYQKVTGPLMANSHPGSYTGQDAFSDMLVAGVDCRNATEHPEMNATLQSDAAHNLNSNNVVRVKHIVRRLTPLECERLQGFPDGWTDIGEWVDSKGKKHKEADSPRYKALGNSIALPPWKWVLKRLCACYERDATMASLFDGIGGFPLIWEQLNGKGSCLWASEIEEFPIAVTKRRFGE
jgi:DNA (cytosine-5)-methyltransferase 1